MTLITVKNGFLVLDISDTPLRVRRAPGLSSMGGGSAARRGGSISAIGFLVLRCCKVVATMNPAKTMRFVSD